MRHRYIVVDDSLFVPCLSIWLHFRKGLLTMTGALAALQGTPAMVGYGMTKAAVHHLVKSLSGPGSGLPKEAKVLAVLP